MTSDSEVTLSTSKSKKKTPTFLELAERNGIKAKTIDILAEQDFDSTIAVATLSVEVLKQMPGITLGQQGLLLAWVDKLNYKPPPRTAPKPAPKVEKETEKPEQQVSLNSLRNKCGLAEKVAKRMREMGLSDADDESSDTDDDSRKSTRRGKQKSGRVMTANDSVKRRIEWPQKHVYRGLDRKVADYDSLSVPEFCYGHLTLAFSCKDQDVKQRMLQHLQQMMLDASQFDWELVKSFHAIFLQQLEQRQMEWDSDLGLLRSQYLFSRFGGQVIKPKDSITTTKEIRKDTNDFASSGPLFCVPYQTGECKKEGEAHASSRGTVRHVCAFCLKATGRFCLHAEEKCIRKTKKGQDSEA